MLRKFGHTLFVSALMLAGACFTACNDSVIDDNTDGVPVQMCASIASRNAVESRANIEHWSIDEFVAGDTIIVDVWNYPPNSSGTADNPDILYHQPMIFDGSDWIYSPIGYWPNLVGGRLYVYAHSFNTTTNESNNRCVLGDNDPKTGYRTMTFSKCGDWVKDVLVSPVKEVNRTDLVNGKIPLTFYHIMARIKVIVDFDMPDGVIINENNDEVTINRIELHYHSNGGVFTGLKNYVAQWDKDKFQYTSAYIYEYGPDGNGLGWTIREEDGPYDIPELTRCLIPYTSPYISEGNQYYTKMVLTATFEGESEKVVYVKDDLEFTLNPGETTIFNVALNGKDMIVNISVDGDLKWSGDGSSVNAGF